MSTVATTETAIPRLAEPPLPDSFVALILQPYAKKNTAYVKRAWIEQEAGATSGLNGAIRGRAQLSIPESCYIDDTGHFNAVEFTMCFNQLGYIYGAYLACRGLLPGSDGINQFKVNQLPGMLIKELTMRFSRAMDPRSFDGEIWTEAPYEEKAKYWRQVYLIRFWDSVGRTAEGAVTIALLKPDSLALGQVSQARKQG